VGRMQKKSQGSNSEGVKPIPNAIRTVALLVGSYLVNTARDGFTSLLAILGMKRAANQSDSSNDVTQRDSSGLTPRESVQQNKQSPAPPRTNDPQAGDRRVEKSRARETEDIEREN